MTKDLRSARTWFITHLDSRSTEVDFIAKKTER